MLDKNGLKFSKFLTNTFTPNANFLSYCTSQHEIELLDE